MARNSQLHTLKENGIPSPHRKWNDSGKMAEILYTSMRMLHTENSYFARFTQQISSVSTEQSQAGVKSSVKSRMRKGRFRGKRKRATTEKCEATRSEFFGANSKD